MFHTNCTLLVIFIQSLLISGISFAQSKDSQPTSNIKPKDSNTDFAIFLSTLDDSLVTQIQDIQYRLNHSEQLINENEIRTGQYIQDLSTSGDTLQIQNVLLPLAENFGFLKQEIHSLRKAMNNLTTSTDVANELAYLVESEEFFQSELKKLKLPEITTPELSQRTDFDCSLVVDEVTDSGTKISTPLTPLFLAKTKPEEDKFLDLESISAQAQIIQKNNKHFLNLELDIQSQHAKDTYGGIEKNAAMKITVQNGDQISVYNIRDNYGKFDEESRTMSYKAIYPLKPQILEQLKQSAITTIGIIWTTGYEKYELDNRQFFIQHLSCFK